MKRPPSITARLTLSLVLGLSVMWLLSATISVLIVRDQLEQTLDGGLRETAERILPLAVDAVQDIDAGDTDGAGADALDDSGEERVVYQARRSDGSILMRSHDAPAAPFDAPLAEGFASVASWRVYTALDRKSGLVLQVAESEERREEAVWQSAGVMFLPLLVLVPIAALLIALFVRRGLAPLRDLGREVASRDAATLDPLEDIASPVELEQVRAAIDGMLTRLRAAFQAERALAANSAHELRTPIAASLAQTQRLVEELQDHPARERAMRVEDTLRRLSALAAKLLALSRAEAGVSRLPSAIDLMPALRLMLEDTRRTLGERLKLEMRPDARLRAPLDVDAFAIVIRNLVENAQTHGDPQAPVEIMVGDGVLEVTNGGPVIPAEHLAVLARRFERGNTSTPGSGLGLAIVDGILRQVGGRLELFSPGRGRVDGFTARIVLTAPA